MSLTKSAAGLVLHAEQALPSRLPDVLKAHPSLRKGLVLDSAVADPQAYSPWARALKQANDHITVHTSEISEATDAYHEVANLLVAKLHWPNDTITVLPQGSASTRTLIRSPNGGEKFDIDAVCQVDISRVAARNPMGFFQSVGDALKELEAEAKKRCWNIPFPRRPFYLEFTPSVPLGNVPQPTLDSMAPRYRVVPAYRATALAVVDTPTASWKTSNPAGMTQWVDDTAKRRLVRQVVMDAATFNKAAASVKPVPDQEVEITDTLRVAIRLFKRHRDMAVRRNIIAADAKPLSIIIVTLLTRCYEGLADLGRIYSHPVEVLADLASLMPHLILKFDGKYWIANPTVEGENFAEKWNQDYGERYRAFAEWGKALFADLQMILTLTDPQEISKRVCEVFGIPAPTTGGTGLSSTGYSAPRPTPSSRGLA